MTPQYRQQSVMFTKFLKRLGQQPPSFLLKLYKEELQVNQSSQVVVRMIWALAFTLHVRTCMYMYCI